MRNSSLLHSLPDLVIKICPLGCNEKCDRTWINETIGHRIICRCKCRHNKKQVALEVAPNPAANANTIKSHKEVVLGDE